MGCMANSRATGALNTHTPTTRAGELPQPACRPAPERPARTQLPTALQTLHTRIRAAMAARRIALPGSERYRRADEEVAYLNELFSRLQRHLDIPADPRPFGP